MNLPAQNKGAISEPYRPNLQEFCDILREYSDSGLEYFKKQSDDIQLKIRSSLGNKLEDDPRQVERKFSQIKKGKPGLLNFLPMPEPSGRDFHGSFFLPRITASPPYTCAFTVLFWINSGDGNGKTCALRLDPSGGEGNAHGYPHMQLTRVVQGLNTDFEPWTPCSYPAVPLGYQHPIQLFLGIAAAVHGYDPGAQGTNQYLHKAINRSLKNANAISKILREVERMLKASAVG